MCFLSEEGVQDIMEAVEVAAILKPSKKIHPGGETVMLSLCTGSVNSDNSWERRNWRVF